MSIRGEEEVEVIEEGDKMEFLDHVEDLRKTLFKCAGAFLGSGIVVGCFFPFFSKILNWPLKKALENSPGLLQGLVTSSPMGIFSVLLQVFFLGSLALSLPFIIYFIAEFIAPGLTKKEKRFLIPGCLAVLTLFGTGALFTYFFILPTTLKVSIHLNELFQFQLIWSAPTYYGLVVWMTLGIGLCFEFPVAIVIMCLIGVIDWRQLMVWRRYVFVLILIAAALITPGGDPFSLFLVALPLYGLYEVAIIICRRLRRDDNQNFN